MIQKENVILGVVTEALPNILFRIQRQDDGSEIMAYLSGRMRMNKIRILVGDKVEVEMNPYGGKGRIVRRL